MSRFKTHLLVKKTELNANDLQQCLRLAFGSSLGFFICKYMGWSYGVFYTVFPMLLLGMLPKLERTHIYQYLANVALVTAYVPLVQGLFGSKPVPMVIIVGLTFLWLFRIMSQGRFFLFAACAAVHLSIVLHFASYSNTDVQSLIWSHLFGALTSLLIALLMMWLFADKEPRAPRPPMHKTDAEHRHEVILGATLATLSFVAFQCLDLKSDLPAQVATLLILFPMRWKAGAIASWNRILGTLVGCVFGLITQAMLFSHYGNLLFVLMLFWISVMLFARYLCLEGGVSAGGFSAMSSLGTLYSQYLTPTQDMLSSSVYRVTSLSIAVMLTLCIIYLMHKLLNQFQATRLSDYYLD